AARGGVLDRAEHRVADVDELSELGEVPAQQGEVVPFIQVADGPDAVHPALVAELAPQCVPRIGRVRDQAISAYDLGCSAHQARLRVLGVNVEVGRHASGAYGLPPAVLRENPCPD